MIDPWLDDGPQYADMLWKEEGLCWNTDPSPFFPDRGASTVPAKMICYICPVQNECLEFAIEKPQPGVWGGKSETERAKIRRERRR